MSQSKTLISQFEPPHVSLRGYITGFVTSIVLTLSAYAVAVNDAVSATAAIALIAVAAALQCLVQLRAFLHLGAEFKPRWKLLTFAAMLIIVLIVVIGSLWIMNNLNYNMQLSPAELNKYVSGQDGL